jgi:6-phosphogluconolactonase
MADIQILKTPEEVAAKAAELAAAALTAELRTHNTATFVLAGGSLPPVAWNILADTYASTFDWSKILFLIGDERCVPLDNPQSNWLTALDIFAAHPEVPAAHQLRPKSDLPAEEAAADYTAVLQTLPHNQSGLPRLSHLWLGVGEDGHTLSLFPNHPSSQSSNASDELVIAVHDSPKPPPDRITLTFRALQGAQSAVVILAGSGKAPVLARIAAGEHDLPIVKATRIIEAAGGHVTWLVDEAAMAQVPGGQNLGL